MVFDSPAYALFLPVIVVLYWRLRHRAQNLLLLAASWTFYALFDWRFLGLMLLLSAVDYRVGSLLARIDAGGQRRRILAGGLAVNLGILATFKYAGFFVDSAGRLLAHLGLQAHRPVLSLVLPIGISFYTFHGISYMVDSYRRQVKPASSFVDFAVFIAFFPQLVAGPIGRATIQLPQIERPRRRLGRDQVATALGLILLGLFKKIVVADGVAPFVNAAFADVHGASAVTLLLGAIGFALQIYGDFSGYTDIARGSARLLGIELPLNFTQPYLSRSITEFWRRWHISLSTWLRDYLYVPLGGSRSGRLRTYRNLIVTMLLGGLWHGAAWTFVAWGGGHGVLLAAERATGRRDRGERPVRLGDLGRILATVAAVTLLWIPFRARSFSDTIAYLHGLIALRPGSVDADGVLVVAFALAAVVAIDLAQRQGTREFVARVPPSLRGAIVGAMLVALIVASGGAMAQFIYFRF